jgi:RimJ/RimL family protein N-acetyltransferase
VDDPKAVLLAALPDIPRWLEARALLALAEAELYASPEGFVVSSPLDKLACGVGQPAPHLFTQALTQIDPEWIVLAAPEDADAVGAGMPNFERERAILHVLEGPIPRLAAPDPDVIRLGPDDLRRVPESMARELERVIRDTEVLGLETAGVIASVAYAASETERLYDLSIDTFGPHRKKGYAERVMRALLDRRSEVKRPVWGATESNEASRRLAARLGFRPFDEIVVFTPKSSAGAPS